LTNQIYTGGWTVLSDSWTRHAKQVATYEARRSLSEHSRQSGRPQEDSRVSSIRMSTAVPPAAALMSTPLLARAWAQSYRENYVLRGGAGSIPKFSEGPHGWAAPRVQMFVRQANEMLTKLDRRSGESGWPIGSSPDAVPPAPPAPPAPAADRPRAASHLPSALICNLDSYPHAGRRVPTHTPRDICERAQRARSVSQFPEGRRPSGSPGNLRIAPLD
jgi:hypothetical protein